MRKEKMPHIKAIIIDGGLAVVGLLASAFVARFIPSFKFSPYVLLVLGLIIAGYGLSIDGRMGSFIAGFGLGFAVPAVMVAESQIMARVSA
jgi:ABC-type iron transport system FetAB permease component